MINKQGLISKIIGVVILFAIIIIVVIIKNKDGITNKSRDAVDIYGAIGGGKENLLADEEINKIFEEKYKIRLNQDSWSNGKTVKVPVVRENGNKYDLIFFSDQRYYDEYKTRPEEGEAERYSVIDGQLTLNTPIVMYSWKEVVDVLMKENIVTYDSSKGIYYITDMLKLMNYITEGKKWKDIGLDSIYGSINIGSVDPVTSSPGATYYGLLLSIYAGGDINDKSVEEALPKLKTFYQKSGYMNNTPADLFSMFLKTGMGAKPIIVDYEKSLIDFANSNPEGWKQVIILYPTPTIWNSHCIAALSEDGAKLIDAFEDEKVSQVAWEKYGFRVGVTGGNYDVSKIEKNVAKLPQEITSVTAGLKMEYYERLISYLSEN